MTVKRHRIPSILLGSCLFAAMLTAAPLASSADLAMAADEPAPQHGIVHRAFHAFSDRANELAMRALGLIGIRYKYGGNTPESGLDCSGLVRYVFKQTWGADLPRTSEEISRVGAKVDTQDLRPGDLVFYNTLRRGFSHVGIYLGDNKFIHSPSAGSAVRVESMDLSYWKKRFNGARRINGSEQN
ncbi:C40 family peptidase [Noviherbaspirillum pedocola]|uniref:C40 family peptidase n=1 Tax=Noviherbaspirillum pedocola TaxID=2801341 RepID=A0A934SYG2_9BURK|nr:C40 family peptidase [Noviherbaspirillum pedocola]MBK4734048.1 C40 family peptidase [Noviherbaspirillum pedocola]